MTTPRTEELKKLTVAALKAICKEYGLTGYSKLAKPAIIAKVLAHKPAASQSPASQAADVAVSVGFKRLNDESNAQPVPKKAKPAESLPKKIAPPAQQDTTYPDLGQQLPHLPQPRKVDPIQKKFSQPAETGQSLQRSLPVTQQPTTSATMQLSRPILQPSGNLPPVQPSTCPPKSAIQALHEQPDNSADPAQISKPQGSKPTTPAPAGTVGTLKTPGKRFTPLVINRTVSAKAFETKKPANSTDIPYLDFVGNAIIPSLGSISLPPSLAERKVIDKVSLALSQVDKADLGQCVRVSRMFRYAIYLSAQPRLLHNFQGLRLASVMDTYQRRLSTTNLWPYLKAREQELYNARQTYNKSFLGAYFNGKNVICEHLWTNPDHEKQITIAMRFLLTKLFFSFSVGDGRHSSWMEGCITDAQPVVKDEIWRITVRNGLQIESFYVLEATCEVIGHPPSPLNNAMQVDSSLLRADWSLYINTRTPYVPNLLEHLVWTNHEEYDKGISRVWLKRIAKERENGNFARLIAERYILACVVGNSVSGQWKSAAEMRQDFSGLPQQTAQVQPKTPRLNLFLPQYHYVESVHFTTSSRKPLHPALAIVQTPGREFIILKDNGMQVGCEEEGIAAVWTKLIGCDIEGVCIH